MKLVLDSARHNPAPENIRTLCGKTGLTQAEIGEYIGVAPRTLRSYFTGERECPYPTQFALEVLVSMLK